MDSDSSPSPPLRDVEVDYEAPAPVSSPHHESEEEPRAAAPVEPSPEHPTTPPVGGGQYWRALGVLVAALVGGSLLIALSIGLSSRHHNNTSYKCRLNFKVGHSGFASIGAALEACPSYSPLAVCIIIPEGEYRETLHIGHDKTNVVLLGEGSGRTVITSDSHTTLTVMGQGFMAQDLAVKNLAGDGVAVENGSHESIFYRCVLHGGEGHALRLKGKRQFYRSSTFVGRNLTVAGYADSYFQRCDFSAGKENPGEKLVIIGDSRDRMLEDKSALVFHLCRFTSQSTDTTPTTFLGTALMEYARMAFIQSFMDGGVAGYVDPSFPATGYVGIFGNQGPGSAKPVPTFIDQMPSISIASVYSLRSFLAGDEDWIQPREVEVELDLSH